MPRKTKAELDREAEAEAQVEHLRGEIADLPENYLQCRDLKHAWNVERDYYVLDEYAEPGYITDGEIARDLKCLRCESGRQEVYQVRTWGIEKIKNSYHYAEGYQVHGVPRGLTPKNLVQSVQYEKAMAKIKKAKARKAGSTVTELHAASA